MEHLSDLSLENMEAVRVFFCKLYARTVLKIEESEYLHDKSVRGEFFREVYTNQKLDDQLKSKIIACGLKALKGEEI